MRGIQLSLTTTTGPARAVPGEETVMSNASDKSDRRNSQAEIDDVRREPAAPQGFRQRYGAILLLAGFGALIALMVVMQKRMAG